MEVFGREIKMGLSLSLYNVVHDTYSHVWKLEILISSTCNFYYNDNIQNVYKRGKKITNIYHAFWCLKMYSVTMSVVKL